MEWIEQAVIIIHVLIAVALVVLVLMQQGKGAEAGASFGAGASQTVFGSSGSGNFLTKMTSIFAVIFFVTSFSLAVFAKQKASISGESNLVAPTPVEAVGESVEAESSAEAPAVELESTAEGSEVPELE